MTRSGVSVGLTIGVGAGASHSFKFATARPRLSVLFCLVLCFGGANAMEDISNPVVNGLSTAVGTLSSSTVPSPCCLYVAVTPLSQLSDSLLLSLTSLSVSVESATFYQRSGSTEILNVG